MSLSDRLFVGMFDGDGDAPVTVTGGTCCECKADTSDADEALCRLCWQDQPSVYGPDSAPRPTSGEVQDMGARLLAAASTLPHGWSSRASTATARAVPLQTAAGTRSPHIPLVIVSPRPMTEMQPLAACSSAKKKLTEEQAAKKKLTDRESQKRKV